MFNVGYHDLPMVTTEPIRLATNCRCENSRSVLLSLAIALETTKQDEHLICPKRQALDKRNGTYQSFSISRRSLFRTARA